MILFSTVNCEHDLKIVSFTLKLFVADGFSRCGKTRYCDICYK